MQTKMTTFMQANKNEGKKRADCNPASSNKGHIAPESMVDEESSAKKLNEPIKNWVENRNSNWNAYPCTLWEFV